MKPFSLRQSVDGMPRVRHGCWLRVGDWVFDPKRNELSRGATRVQLDPKLSASLLYLARHAGQVVARDELQLELSPTVMLCDRALTQLVIRLRRALGDTAKPPSYIETVARRGYRFIAPVSWISSNPQAKLAETTAFFAHVRQRSTEYVLFALIFTAVATLLLIASWQAHRNDDDVDALVREVASVRAIAGLPVLAIGAFETAGGTPEEGQLARGLRTHLIADLSRIPSVRVLSGDGVPPFARRGRGRAAAAFAIAGDLRRTGDRVAVRVRLTAGESGRVLLTETFDRPYVDLLRMQDDMASSMQRVLASELNVSSRREALPLTRSLQAYEEHVRALGLIQDGHSVEHARNRYWRAVQLDPLFARGYAALALTYVGERRRRVGDKELDRALELARTAEQIDATIPDIYWLLAWVHGQRRNHVDALKHLRTALALNPSFADAYGLLGSILIDMGRAAHAIEPLKAALQLNESGGFLYSLLLGRAYFHTGDHAQAVAHLRVAVERSPSHLESHVYLAAALALAGQPDAAGWAIEEIRTVRPNFALGPWLAAHAVPESKQLEKIGSALRGLGL